jgi:FixJ family two-component response regulator
MRGEIAASFAGAAEILQKPFTLTMLREILEKHLSTEETAAADYAHDVSPIVNSAKYDRPEVHPACCR